MGILILGIYLYVVMYSIVIFYQLVIKHKDPEWLMIYIPINLIILAGMAAFYYSKIF